MVDFPFYFQSSKSSSNNNNNRRNPSLQSFHSSRSNNSFRHIQTSQFKGTGITTTIRNHSEIHQNGGARCLSKYVKRFMNEILKLEINFE